MRSIARHTKAFGRVFTLVFLLASSGFTAILQICALEACECCDTSAGLDHDIWQDMQLPQSVPGMSIHNVDDCHINARVDDFAVVQALLEKDSNAQKVKVLSVLAPTFVSTALSNTSSWFNCSHLETISPPSVEKYVLNATLLI
jgi:hypothetical protein